MFKQFFLPLFILCTFSLTLAAQGTTEEEARDDLDYYNTDNDRVREQRGDSFGQNLWFGTGAQLGFQGGNNTSFFQIGLSPIVGYKINNFLSVGPRGSFAYNSYKDGFADINAKFVTWSAGAFVRAKVIYPFFVHTEYSLVNEVEGFDRSNDDKTIRSTRAIPFLGGGVSQGGGQGGGAGYEILILFRLSQADRIGDSPFELRTGLNFNF